MSQQFQYASVNEAPVYESVHNNKGQKLVNRILRGTYVLITGESDDWYQVRTAGNDGWMHKDKLSDDMGWV